MTTSVIGATGRIGSAVTQRLLGAGAAVRVLVRDPAKAKRLFGDVASLEVAILDVNRPRRAFRRISRSTLETHLGSEGSESDA